VRNQTWWRSLRAIGAELDVTSAYREALATTVGLEAADDDAAPVRRTRKDASGHRSSSKAPAEARRRPGGRRVVVDSGQATLETVAMFPFALLILAIALQTILLGVTFAYSGVAAGVAARAVSLGNNPQAAVADALPSGMHSKVSVAGSGSSVNVTVKAPLLVGSGVTRDVPITVDHRVVEEPR
jgi:pilus assembly protein CpaE